MWFHTSNMPHKVALGSDKGHFTTHIGAARSGGRARAGRARSVHTLGSVLYQHECMSGAVVEVFGWWQGGGGCGQGASNPMAKHCGKSAGKCGNIAEILRKYCGAVTKPVEAYVFYVSSNMDKQKKKAIAEKVRKIAENCEIAKGRGPQPYPSPLEVGSGGRGVIAIGAFGVTPFGYVIHKCLHGVHTQPDRCAYTKWPPNEN